MLLAAIAVFEGCGRDVASSIVPTSPTSPSSALAEVAVDAVLVGAGDIARCGSAATAATARLLDRLPGSVFTLGDNAYPSGGEQDFSMCYEPTWGRHKARTRPAPGNHDYESAGAAPYFNYFGANAGPSGLGYYRYRLGAWQIYSLNSNIAMGPRSLQAQWLQRELAANPSTCTLAYWHHPLFSSGPHGDNPSTQSLWRVLYQADVDVVVSAHDHLYERFAPQDPDGRLDLARGIRQFTAGTGGAALYEAVRVHANSEARASLNGVLRFELKASSYTWALLSDTGASADAGNGRCHGSPDAPPDAI